MIDPELQPCCRICLEEDGPFLQPCKCKGTIGYIHSHCLDRMNTFNCDLCKEYFPYNFKRLLIHRIELVHQALHMVDIWFHLAYGVYHLYLLCYNHDGFLDFIRQCFVILSFTIGSGFILFVSTCVISDILVTYIKRKVK